MRKDKKTQSEIARYIGVSQATVSKELNRNADTRGRYSPKMVQMFADMMKERSRRPYKFNDKMRALISDKLEKYQWSPEQIKGYCQANDIEMVSVEWIYRFIREDKLNGGSLYRHCRHRLKHRKRPIGAGSQEHPRQAVDKGKTAGGREKRRVRTLRDVSHTKRKRLHSHYNRT